MARRRKGRKSCKRRTRRRKKQRGGNFLTDFFSRTTTTKELVDRATDVKPDKTTSESVEKPKPAGLVSVCRACHKQGHTCVNCEERNYKIGINQVVGPCPGGKLPDGRTAVDIAAKKAEKTKAEETIGGRKSRRKRRRRRRKTRRKRTKKKRRRRK
jgi:hypothetical protein